MQRDYAPDETKRDVDELEKAPVEEEGVEKAAEKSAGSKFVDTGDKPPVSEVAEAAGPTASQRAFGGGDFDADAARQWNEAHPELVAEFNKLTSSACVVDGIVDPEKVRDWQRAHGMAGDGKVAASTIGKARTAAIPAGKAAETGGEAHESRRENAPEEQQAVAKDAMTPAPMAEVATAAVVTETTAIDEQGDSFMEANEVEEANDWNDKHEAEVAAFNKATDNSCMVKGKLDARKVWDWQDNHGITADGCVDTKTVLAAQDFHKAQHPEPKTDVARTFA